MFSVIIPNYNRSHSIKLAINSVLQQSYTNFEVIVVDDLSTDDSLKEIKKIKDSRLKVFQLNLNSGAAAARNFGVGKSSGDIISFLDSDDYYEKDFLRVSRETLVGTDPSIGFMWAGVRYHLKNNKSITRSWNPVRKDTPYLTFLHNLHIGTGSGISIKKEAFSNCGGFNENLPAAEDTDFFLRLTQLYDFCFTEKVLINVVKNGKDRVSVNYSKIAQAYNLFLPQHFSFIDRDKTLQLKYYYKLMWLNYHLRAKKEARQFYRRIPGSLYTGKFKALIICTIYEMFSLDKAFNIHQKFSSH